MNKCLILFLVYIQSAVAELEKALDIQINVIIYKHQASLKYCAHPPGWEEGHRRQGEQHPVLRPLSGQQDGLENQHRGHYQVLQWSRHQ